MASKSNLKPESANRPELQKKQTQRLPPPTLFQGPPSRNASNASLPSMLLPGAHTAAIAPPPSTQHGDLLGNRSQRAPNRQEAAPGGNSYFPQKRPPQQSEGDRNDALWAEMQNTLAEVELSAARGMHVFGPEHARALEELRLAQTSLAQAWVRSEADEVSDDQTVEVDGSVSRGAGVLSPTAGGSGAGGKDGQGKEGEAKKKLSVEEETEDDIKLARKRREANDRYFQRVNGGVLDVVAKLEDVALAMRAVEKGSRDIWSESDSIGTSMNSGG